MPTVTLPPFAVTLAYFVSCTKIQGNVIPRPSLLCVLSSGHEVYWGICLHQHVPGRFAGPFWDLEESSHLWYSNDPRFFCFVRILGLAVQLTSDTNSSASIILVILDFRVALVHSMLGGGGWGLSKCSLLCHSEQSKDRSWLVLLGPFMNLVELVPCRRLIMRPL